MRRDLTGSLLSGVGLSLLALAAIALSVAALRQPPANVAAAVSPTPEAAGPRPSPAGPAGPGGQGGPAARPSALPHSDDGAAGLLADLFGTARLLGTTTGDCTGDSTVSWSGAPATLPAPHLLRLKLTGARSGWVVAADDRCAARFYSTSDAGATWSKGSAVTSTWYLSTGSVHAPTTQATSGCAQVLQLAVASPTAAAVWCGDALRTSTDGGLTWSTTAPAPGQVAALELVRAGDVRIASTGVTGCAGVAVLRLQSSRWTTLACVADLQLGAAPLALSFDGSRGLLTTPTTSWRSSDGGRTWTTT